MLQRACVQLDAYAPSSQQEPDHSEVLLSSEVHPCYECGVQFDSARGLRTHMLHVHAARSEAAFWAHGSTCVACLKLFHTRARPVQHLKHGSTWCLKGGHVALRASD